ncbi:HAD family hydrolase [Gracilibacillus oryzae]|uniref:HAD family hydrolase n=1 Tax=Gracilibacillus oryzae TaxID=1672701 RepID=A0A7C8GT36_9BACI|nr:HAD family hydrolase [Gracilibacillus oryzae]KAB8135705.1 HAD family hydrolase [Gracilibacillus oryzae]
MIFFDIDSTLLDHERAEKMAAIEFLKVNKEELKFNESDFVKLWLELSLQYFNKFLARELSFQEQRRMRMKELFGNNLSDRLADSKFNDYLSFYKENWVVYEDVIPCLEKLKKQGTSLGIISNGEYKQQMEKLETVNIHKYFDHVITSSQLGVSKPDITIFQQACHQANVNINECYYIGDRMETDAIPSKNAGMKGIWINRNDRTSHLDVHVIHSLNELDAIIN